MADAGRGFAACPVLLTADGTDIRGWGGRQMLAAGEQG